MARWLPLLLTIGLPLAACGGDRPPAGVEATAAAGVVAPPPAAPAPVAPAPPALPGPDVTVMSDGTAILRPRVADVAMLRRMPDGSFRRECGPPEPDMREMIQGMMRARRGAK